MASDNSQPQLGKKTATQTGLRAKIIRAVHLIEGRYHNPPSVKELAKVAGLSVSHFHRAFQIVVGESAAQHILRLRLEYAASLLKHSTWQVGDIGTAAGFTTAASFSRGFKKLYGLTPQGYRRAESIQPFLKGSLRSLTSLHEAEDHHPSPTVRIESWPDLDLISLRAYCKVSQLIQPWVEILRWGKDSPINLEEARFFGLWFDDWSSTDSTRYRYECAIYHPDLQTMDIPEPFLRRRIPTGHTAVSHARGDLNGLDKAWQNFALGWLPLSGFQPRLEYAFDEYPADLILSNVFKKIVLHSLGRIALDLCFPVQREDVSY